MSVLNDLISLMKTNLSDKYSKKVNTVVSGKHPLYRYALSVNGDVVAETTSISALAAAARLLEIQIQPFDGQVDDE
jgi:hypothetical protein